MIRHLLIIVSLAVIVGGCQSMEHKHKHSSENEMSAQHKHGTGSDMDMSATLKAKSREYVTALIHKDMAALDRLWADDLTFVNGRGQVQNKSQRMADIKSGAVTVTSCDISDDTVRMVGDHVAVHIAVSALNGNYNGQQATGNYRTQILWTLRHGEWQISAIQLTLIQ